MPLNFINTFTCFISLIHSSCTSENMHNVCVCLCVCVCVCVCLCVCVCTCVCVCVCVCGGMVSSSPENQGGGGGWWARFLKRALKVGLRIFGFSGGRGGSIFGLGGLLQYESLLIASKILTKDNVGV